MLSKNTSCRTFWSFEQSFRLSKYSGTQSMEYLHRETQRNSHGRRRSPLLLITGQNAQKWSLLVLVDSSFLSDALMAASANRELMIQLGLFTGTYLQIFWKNPSKNFFSIQRKGAISYFPVITICLYLNPDTFSLSMEQDKDFAWQLLGVWSIFFSSF